MSEETTETVDQTTTETPQGGESPETKGMLRDLQDERSKRQSLQKQLDDIQKASKEAETKRLEEQNEFKTIAEQRLETITELEAKVADYEPQIEEMKARDEERKTALLEKLGDDADDFKGLDVPALEKVVEKLTKLNPPPTEPGRPATTAGGDFGGYKSRAELALAVAKGVPGAREAYDAIGR